MYRAIDAAGAAARDGVQHPVPPHLRNAVTALGKQLGHGTGYVYAHDTADGVAAMECLPKELRDAIFFTPGERGFEQKIEARMVENDRLRRRDDG